jgi:hypothetical protein
LQLGNEPEFWEPNGLGGWTADGKWVGGFEAYAQYYRRLALQLNPCSMKKPLLAGPGWGNVNTQDPKWFARILHDDVDRCYNREAAVHYYPYVQNTTIDAKGLLAQDLLDFGVEKYTVYQKMATSYRLPLRISEANSLYGGGRAGFSETMVGTLWCIDALMAFARAGAIGFHFHWGFGGLPGQGGSPNTGVQTNFDKNLKPYPSVHAPWFGYLFFMEASAGNWWSNSDTGFVNVFQNSNTCKGNAKTWALLADSGELRVIFMNKEVSMPCNMLVTVPGSFCKFGLLARLNPGTFGMASVAGITFKGQTYIDATGVIKGKETVFTLYPESSNKDGTCNYNMAMPAASAALLKLPLSATPSRAVTTERGPASGPTNDVAASALRVANKPPPTSSGSKSSSSSKPSTPTGSSSSEPSTPPTASSSSKPSTPTASSSSSTKTNIIAPAKSSGSSSSKPTTTTTTSSSSNKPQGRGKL